MRFWARPRLDEVVFQCPACNITHEVCFGVWSIDLPLSQDSAEVTVHPSILVRHAGGICHSFLQHGIWTFLPDSTHTMSGMQALMIPLVD